MTALDMLVGGTAHTITAADLRRGDIITIATTPVRVSTTIPTPTGRVQVIGEADQWSPSGTALLLPAAMPLTIRRRA